MIDQTTVECQVPAVAKVQTVTISLKTTDGFAIDKRALSFEFINEMVITSVYPVKGSLDGGYEFTLTGNFQIAIDKGI